MTEERPNRLTLGAITLERPNGALTHTNAIAQYLFTDEQMMQFWDYLAENKEINEAIQNLHQVCQKELRQFGKNRINEKNKKKN